MSSVRLTSTLPAGGVLMINVSPTAPSSSDEFGLTLSGCAATLLPTCRGRANETLVASIMVTMRQMSL